MDGSVEMVESEFPEFELLRTGGNLGYGRANNAAFALAQGRYFCALNSDTEVPAGSLATLRDFLESHPRAGAAGPQFLYPDGRLQTSHYPDPDFRGIIAEQTFLAAARNRFRGLASSEDATSDLKQPIQVDQIVGACQFVRADAFAAAGGYDPAFFMYHEDVDLNFRLRESGWEIYFVPSATIVHHLGASSEKHWRTRARMVAALNWSRYYDFSRRDGRLTGEFLKALFIFGAGIRLAAWTVLALGRPSALDRLRLFRVVFRRAVAMRPDRETRDGMSGIG